MPTFNPINANTVGLVNYQGSGTFTAATTTTHDVLVGAAGNGITNVSPSTAGLVLTSNGILADPSFQPIPSTPFFLSVNTQVFTATGTYTPTTNMVYCIVEVIGCGGGGSGSGTAGGYGGGGGAGGYVRAVFSAAAIGATAAITIPNAGTGGTNASGAAGGNVTFVGSTASITANGGGGGIISTSSAVAGFGGVGGTGSCSGQTGSSLIAKGSAGGLNYATTGYSYTGHGASSFYGAGASPAYCTSSNTVNGNAAPANSYGAGGSSSTSPPGSGSQTGGAGSKGIVVVTEYIS